MPLILFQFYNLYFYFVFVLFFLFETKKETNSNSEVKRKNFFKVNISSLYILTGNTILKPIRRVIFDTELENTMKLI